MRGDGHGGALEPVREHGDEVDHQVHALEYAKLGHLLPLCLTAERLGLARGGLLDPRNTKAEATEGDETPSGVGGPEFPAGSG